MRVSVGRHASPGFQDDPDAELLTAFAERGLFWRLVSLALTTWKLPEAGHRRTGKRGTLPDEVTAVTSHETDTDSNHRGKNRPRDEGRGQRAQRSRKVTPDGALRLRVD